MSEDIDVASSAAGHRVLARAIMPTHFHIILKHGSKPLGWMMQRVMQRAWIRIKREHGVRGHVFESRYWAEPIPTSKYLRRAIVYTHLNPCKASICDAPEQYDWSSHNKYAAYASGIHDDDVGFGDGLMLFADESLEPAAIVRNYLRFVEFCQERRRSGDAGDWLLPGSMWFADVPLARHGDEHWLKTYTHFDGGIKKTTRAIDARTLAIAALHRIDPGLDLDTLRFGARLPQLREPRRQLICALKSAGCRNSGIARLLNISPSAVSNVTTAMALSVAQEQ